MRQIFPPASSEANSYFRTRMKAGCSAAHRAWRIGALLAAVALFAAGCAKPTPQGQSDICTVFDQFPDWYDYAHDS
ncbi:MAG: hypothetical protein OXE50_15695, partial [Chloroflexi bacterium]|nr:hypothetical protein [Chloroflexota bacterium]